MEDVEYLVFSFVGGKYFIYQSHVDGARGFLLVTKDAFKGGEPILGWYHQELLQGMVKEPKMTKWFLRPSSLSFFTTIIFFSHVYQLHALIYDLKFILELNNLDFKNIYS